MPVTNSPGLKSGWRDCSTQPTAGERITPPIGTGSE